jgi:hypothetical protein
MAFQKQQIAMLRRILKLTDNLLREAERPQRTQSLNGTGSTNGAGRKRIRRSGKALAQFRRMLKAKRKQGVPVAELARKHRISTTYIYTL